MGRDREYPLRQELKDNLDKLLSSVNQLRSLYGKPLIVSSGYRPGTYNEAAKGAKDSAHLYCLAVDFKDKDQELSKWLLSRPDVLEACGLYMEDPAFTKSWCHLQLRRPASGNLVFKPDKLKITVA